MNIFYEGSKLFKKTEYESFLNFETLGITPVFEERSKVGVNASYGNWLDIYSDTHNRPMDQTQTTERYSKTISNLSPGSIYQFRVKLKNKYGSGWYSNVSDDIVIPAPSPLITNLEIKSKFFENIITWDVHREIVNETEVQTVYKYNIEKQYLNDSSWITDTDFTNFYSDLSGVLDSNFGDLEGSSWTGPYNPKNQLTDISGVKSLKIIDTDISLNTVYRYNIECFPLVVAPENPSTFFVKTTIVTDGTPKNVKYNYNVNDASLNITWTLNTDISSNTDVVWDISWQEIRKNSTHIHNYGVEKYYDVDLNVTTDRLRTITLPIDYLQPDASYNIQIKGDYDNNTMINNYSRNSQNIQQTQYSYNNMLPSGKIENDIITYYNYQEPPILNDIKYDLLTDKIVMNWSATTIPAKPYYYNISFLHSSYADISYNFIVDEGTQLLEPLNNGINYFPGVYKVKVRALYGYHVPTTSDISGIFSEWSEEKSLNKIPNHLPTNAKIYKNGTTIIINWDRIKETEESFIIPNHLIPKSYYLIRNETSIENTLNVDISNNIHRETNSYHDKDITINRIYSYDLSANYI